MEPFPLHIREYALQLLLKGYSPKRISIEIKKEFGIFVPPGTISKWKERYLKKELEEMKQKTPFDLLKQW